jgi:ribonuclease J
MQYRRLAQDLGYEKKSVLIPEDGEVLEFTGDRPPKVVDRLTLENIMIDGLGVGDVGNAVLRDRQTIATDGIVVVVVPVEAATGRMTSNPEIITRGFVYVKESRHILDGARNVVARSLKMKREKVIDWQFMRKRVEESLASFFHTKTGRSPLIVPVILEV